MKNTTIAVFVIGEIIVFMYSCRRDIIDTNQRIDAALFSEVTASGYSYFEGGSTLPSAAPSPHGSFKLRFNAIATAVLDSSGKLPVGKSFPTGSVLVKEVYGGDSSINLYAVMKKDPSSINAGSGWLWAKFNPDGSALYSTTERGLFCISCHSGSPNRDFVRTFDLH